MCGRYQSRFDKQRIAEEFYIRNLDGVILRACYNIAPMSTQPVIVRDQSTGELAIHKMRWGLIPEWVKDPKPLGTNTINAEAEILAKKRIWRTPLKKRRCIVPADGFYEWQRRGAKAKQPYLLSLRTGLMAFAGLWESWLEPGIEQPLESYAIITTEANELTKPIHNRMPMILKRQDYDRWLTCDDREQPPIDLLRPYDADLMTAWTVDPRVRDIRNDDPGLRREWRCSPDGL